MRKQVPVTGDNGKNMKDELKKEMVTIDHLGSAPFQNGNLSLQQIHRVVRQRLFQLKKSHIR